MRLLELTSDAVFKAFMMSEKTKDYKARLIHLITGIPEEDLRGDNIMEEAYEELEKISMDKNIIGLYDKEKVEQKILNTKLEGARLEEINQRNLEIARNLLKRNMKISDIMEITGLNEQQINSIEE